MKKKPSSQSGFFGARVLLGFVLGLVGIFLVLVGFGMSSGSSALAQNSLAAGVKIAPEVLVDTADGKNASVVILLADQADVTAAYGMKDQDARGWFVYNTLTQHAARTQAGLQAFLTARGASYQSFWAANMIVATASRSLVESLAGRTDVARIDSNRPARWIEDPEVANFGVTPPSATVPNTVEWGVNNVNAPAVWALGFTGQGMVLGDLDTGQRWTHNALKPKYRGWNGVVADHNFNWHDAIHSGGGTCGANTLAPCDDFGHGTHTAGTTVGDDGSGNQVGVAPGAKWIGCRNMNQGAGTPATYTECFQFMIAPTDLAGNNANPALRPHVLNNSWGCPGSEGCVTRAELETIVNNTQAAGIFVEVSAGNSGPSCSSVTDAPAIYSASFSTGAIDISNVLASFSSRGPSTFYTPNLLKPNVSAPGVNVRSTTRTTDNSFGNMSGTSMAGPHVVGVVALLWSARPGLVRDIDATKTILQNTANPGVTVSAQTCGGTPSTQIPNNSFGYGRVDALAAVNAAPAATPTPTPSPTTGTPTPTPTSTATATATPTATATATSTATATATVAAPTSTPSPTPTATATATATPTATATTTPVATATSTVVPTPTPSSTPAAQPINLSTRMRVQTDAEVGIGGFIITGTAPKHLLLRAIGPSLTQFGVPNVLADPVMELHGPGGFATITNDNWRDDPVQEALIIATGIAPTNNFESAIDAILDPGAYTAIVRGKNNSSGVALVEVYDLGQAVPAKLANISTRALVGTGTDIVIAGFILGNNSGVDTIVVRGLSAPGVPNPLADPKLELRDASGVLIASDNDWQDDPAQAAALTAVGLAPPSNLDAAIVATLPPSLYTVLLSGRNSGTGVGLVEVYDLANGVPVATPTPGTPTPTATATSTPPLSTPIPCIENFDGVTAPALPPHWTATNPDPGDGTMWVTTTVTSDSAPNNAFIADQDGISDKVLDRTGVTITSAAAVMSFRNNFNTEYDPPPAEIFWDGYVLEVSSPNISGGAFLDVTDSHVGGSFVSGGYTGEIDGTASNPLAGRMAWSGDSGGYIDTVINLGPNVAGQTITLRFRMGSDEATGRPGVHIDNISITGSSCP